MKNSQPLRARWAAVGAAVAVTIGAGGAWVTHAASPPSSVVLIEPARILDTRDGIDLGLPGPFTSPAPQDLKVTGEIPTAAGDAIVVPEGATGVLLNVTPVNAEADGFISVRPADATGVATTSSLNFTAGQTNPNSVQVEVPTTGTDAGLIEISYDALGVTGPSTNILVDVVGYTLASGVDAAVTERIDALEAEIDDLQVAQPFAATQRRGFTMVGTADQVLVNLRMVIPTAGEVTVMSTTATGENTADDEVRCSITTGTSLDGAYLQRWESGGAAMGRHAQLAGVRTFEVAPGVEDFNLVCNHVGAVGTDSNLEASVLSAIFTPAHG